MSRRTSISGELPPNMEDGVSISIPAGPVDRCTADLDVASKACLERLAYVLEPVAEVLEDVAYKAVAEGVRGAVSTLSRAAADATQELWDAAQAEARKQIKAQQSVFEIKLARTRTASLVSLQNQAAEMEASKNRELESRASSGTGETNTDLEQAHKRLEELSRKLSGEEIMKKKLNELLVTTEQLHAASEAQVARLEARLIVYDEESQDQARAHLKTLQAQKVAEHGVRTMLEEAQEELAELRKEVRADCVLTSCRLRADCAPIARLMIRQAECDGVPLCAVARSSSRPVSS